MNKNIIKKNFTANCDVIFCTAHLKKLMMMSITFY